MVDITQFSHVNFARYTSHFGVKIFFLKVCRKLPLASVLRQCFFFDGSFVIFHVRDPYEQYTGIYGSFRESVLVKAGV